MRRTLTGLLLSSMFLTAAAYASSPNEDASASTLRVSTGVIPPQVINQLSISQSDSLSDHPRPASTLVTVSYTVDEAGLPRNIQIVRGSDFYWNARVVNAVQNLRYRPATMNNKPIAIGMILNVNFAK